jgi:hypothetical protein
VKPLGLGLWVGLLALSSAARAQNEGPAYAGQRAEQAEAAGARTAITVALMPVFGVWGSASSTAKAEIDVETLKGSWDRDLQLSFGFGAHVDFPISEHLSIGPLVRFIDWALEDRSSHAEFVDFAVAPRVRTSFELGGKAWGTLFVELPIGIAVAEYPNDADLVRGTLESTPAFVFGLMGGTQLFFTEHVGVVLEVGGLRHSFSTHLKGTLRSADPEDEVPIDVRADLVTSQLMLQVGVVVAL